MIVFFGTLCIILTICYGCYWCAEDEGLFFVQKTSQVKPRKKVTYMDFHCKKMKYFDTFCQAISSIK